MSAYRRGTKVSFWRFSPNWDKPSDGSFRLNLTKLTERHKKVPL